MAAVLRVENVTKEYRLGVMNRRMFYEELNAWWARRRGRPDPYALVGGRIHKAVGGDRIWALQEVSFEVEQGQALGIIGHNGSGKSTLLKILSEITSPTSGRVLIKGKVASLLEVGTGFHPELTGRDNIFLSGTILGMKKAEVHAKLAQIVEFSGVGEFIDTPVKRYSSGMYMRLAFAVAAHLEPEILIIDEVLAVGDAEFQKKCLGKMDEITRSGRTVLFVSHNMTAVRKLCQKVVILDAGKVDFAGEPEAAIDRYLNVRAQKTGVPIAQRTDRQGNQKLRFERLEILDDEGREVSKMICGRDYTLRFHYAAPAGRGGNALVAFNIQSSGEQVLSNLNSADAGMSTVRVHERGYFACRLPRLGLRADTYRCNLFCSLDGEIADWIENAFTLEVEDGDYFGTGRLIGREAGQILVPQTWENTAAA